MRISNYRLPYIEIYGGSREPLEFDFYTKSNDPYENAHEFSVNFSLVEYINQDSNTPVLEYSSGKGDNIEIQNGDEGLKNRVRIILDAKDTYKLWGKYIYQVIIANEEGFLEIAGQGIMRIFRNTNPAFLENIEEA